MPITLRKNTENYEALHVILDLTMRVISEGNELSTAAWEQITEAHGAEARTFHDMQHIEEMAIVTSKEVDLLRAAIGNEELAKKTRDRITIAAFGHDCAYPSVDGGLPEKIADITLIKDTIRDSDGTYHIKDDCPDDAKIIAEIFDFTPGDTLNPFGGQNEYISALVTYSQLIEHGVSQSDAIQTIVLTEATRPFRSQEAFDQLEERFRGVNDSYRLGISEDEIRATMIGAAHIANKDVISFVGNAEYAEKSKIDRFKTFVQGTWRLLPENTAALRDTEFTPADYRAALQRTNGFLSGLDADNIFHSAHEYPSAEEMERMTKVAKENLEASDLYIKTKIGSAALVEAFASLAQANGTMIDFVAGTVKDESLKVERGANGTMAMTALKEEVVLAALQNRGDEGSIGFDIPQSPIGAFLLGNLGEEKVRELAAAANKHIPADGSKAEYEEYLIAASKIIGAEHFRTIGNALAKVADERSHAPRSGYFQDITSQVIAQSRAVVSANVDGVDSVAPSSPARGTEAPDLGRQ